MTHKVQVNAPLRCALALVWWSVPFPPACRLRAVSRPPPGVNNTPARVPRPDSLLSPLASLCLTTPWVVMLLRSDSDSDDETQLAKLEALAGTDCLGTKGMIR